MVTDERRRFSEYQTRVDLVDWMITDLLRERPRQLTSAS